MHPPLPSGCRRPVIEVSAGLVFRNRQLLIAQRPPGSHLAGTWEFPGGKREREESWEDCLRRELREELDFDAAIVRFYEEVVHDYEEHRVCIRFFLATVQSGEPRPVGCAALDWVTAEGLGGFEFPPADAALLQRLRQDRQLWMDFDQEQAKYLAKLPSQ